MDIIQSSTRSLSNLYTDDQNGKIRVLIFVSLSFVVTLIFSIIGCILVRKRIFKNYFVKSKLLSNPNGFHFQYPDLNRTHHQFYPAHNGYPNPNQPNHFQIEGAGTLPPANFPQNASPSYPIPSNSNNVPALFYPPPSNGNNVCSPPYYPLHPTSYPLPSSNPPSAFYSSLPPSSYPHSPSPSSSLPGISISSRERLIWLGKYMVFYLLTSYTSMTTKVNNNIIYFFKSRSIIWEI